MYKYNLNFYVKEEDRIKNYLVNCSVEGTLLMNRITEYIDSKVKGKTKRRFYEFLEGFYISKRTINKLLDDLGIQSSLLWHAIEESNKPSKFYLAEPVQLIVCISNCIDIEVNCV